jgi:hypothetical protein
MKHNSHLIEVSWQRKNVDQQGSLPEIREQFVEKMKHNPSLITAVPAEGKW